MWCGWVWGILRYIVDVHFGALTGFFVSHRRSCMRCCACSLPLACCVVLCLRALHLDLHVSVLPYGLAIDLGICVFVRGAFASFGLAGLAAWLDLDVLGVSGFDCQVVGRFVALLWSMFIVVTIARTSLNLS
jgi:hypothetical protein